MMRFWKLLAAAVGFTNIVSAALAADVARLPPVVSGPAIVAPGFYQWAGGYIGVQGAWDRNHVVIDDVGVQYRTDANGNSIGIFAGWNAVQAGPWVIGIDGSANWGNAHGTSCGGACVLDTNIDFKGFIRGRAGIAANRLLFYGTLGAVVMHIEDDQFPLGDNQAWGWTAGLGLDWALTDRVFVRLDWAHQNVDPFASKEGGFRVSATADTLAIGLAWKL